MLPDWVFFPTEFDYFLRRSGSGDASTDDSPDISGDVSIGILASTLAVR